MEPLVDELVKLYIGVPASLSMLEVELKKEMRMLVSLPVSFTLLQICAEDEKQPKESISDHMHTTVCGPLSEIGQLC